MLSLNTFLTQRLLGFLYGNCVNFEIMFKSCLDRNTFVLQADPLVVGSF